MFTTRGKGLKDGWFKRSMDRNAVVLKSGASATAFDPYSHDVGKDFPQRVPAFIEVAKNSQNKYEWNQDVGVLQLDRVLHSAVYYPYNYGFVPQTLCGDGDPLDILVISEEPLIPGCLVDVRPLAYLAMSDEKGQDEKVLAVMSKDPLYSDFQSMGDIPKHTLDKISQFFATYKNLEPGKSVTINGWKGTKETYELFEQTHQSYKAKAEASIGEH